MLDSRLRKGERHRGLERSLVQSNLAGEAMAVAWTKHKGESCSWNLIVALGREDYQYF